MSHHVSNKSVVIKPRFYFCMSGYLTAAMTWIKRVRLDPLVSNSNYTETNAATQSSIQCPPSNPDLRSPSLPLLFPIQGHMVVQEEDFIDGAAFTSASTGEACVVYGFGKCYFQG